MSQSDDWNTTGEALWPAANVLCACAFSARRLGHYSVLSSFADINHHRAQFEGKDVLELGSGIGLCGFAAAQVCSCAAAEATFCLGLNAIQFASRCVLTDGVAELIPLLERNCADVQGLLRTDQN